MNGAFRQLLLPLALSAALAACTTQPTRAPAPVAASAPAPEPAIPASAAEAAPAPVTDPWDQLRSSFSMPGCDADPSVLAWAARYTRNPGLFEKSLRRALPRLTYIQQVAEQYDVPGEFVLLPWVESRYRPARGRKHDAAGMWQIMPVTARAMGLRVDRHYDGRLDVPAAANAVMKLLKQYHDEFGDWRVADYAYNAGEFTVKKYIQRHGMPADEPAMPAWPVRKVTREHLAKLLAMACVVREPDRFNVSLPTLPDEQHLVQVPLPRSMPIAQAADHAGMSVSALKDLNAAFRSDTIDSAAASYLLLPVGHAKQFRDALLDQGNRSTASASLPFNISNSDPATPSPVTSAPAITEPRQQTHTVQYGESLWQIARHYSVSTTQLQRWNHLRGNTLKPGQVLQVNGTH